MPPPSFYHTAQNQGLHMTTSSSQQFLTQIPHPFLVPPLLQTVNPVIQPHSSNSPSLISDQGSTTTTESVTEVTKSEPGDRMLSDFKLDSYFQSPNQGLVSMPSHLSETEPHNLLTTSQLYKTSYDQTIITSYPTQLSPSPSPATTPQTHHEQSPLNFLRSSDLPSLPNSFPQAHTSKPQVPFTISTLQPSKPLTLEPEVPVVPKLNQSDQDQIKATEQNDPVHPTKSVNATEISELPQRNTSQSPMTSNDPR